MRRKYTRLCAHCGSMFQPYHHSARYCSSHCAACHQPRPDPVARFWAGVDRAGRSARDCWPWTRAVASGGYGTVDFHGRHMRAHRLAYELAHGAIPPGLFVCHTCDNRRCCNPAHLVLGTHRENMTDMVRKGRQAHGATHNSRLAPESVVRGDAHGNAKLTPDLVRAIRAEYRAGDGPALARRYGVAKSTILRIVRRQAWNHVT